MDIKIQKTSSPRELPQDETNLGFGNIFSDHMFIMEYEEGKGWHDGRIVPYGNLSLSPASSCLHYGQEVFEGLKAYRNAEGKVQLFRPEENFKRINISSKRLVIPEIPVEVALDGLKQLIKLDEKWVPHTEGTSLYIRPFIIAVDEHLGVCSSKKYLFIIICSPSGAYYSTGLDPVDIYVETNYVRAVKGGMGFAKTGGNYASALAAQQEATEQNYSQVLWLDGVEKKYIEEVGAMNIFFVVDGEVITPSLQGSILDGITRKSVIQLCKDWGLTVTERRITMEEIADAHDQGRLDEVFGTGTAAVISPVGHLKWGDKVMDINGGEIGEISQKVYDSLTAIQYGREKDKFGWITPIK